MPKECIHHSKHALPTTQSRTKANRVLPKESTHHSQHTLPTTQRRLSTSTSTDGRHQNQVDYIICSQRWRSSTHSTKSRLEANYGSDHELHIVKFRVKWKKIGNTTRSFKHDLNQIPYDYRVEERNIFKGLDLIDRVPDELWMEIHGIVKETEIKTISKKREKKKNYN